MFLHGVTKNKNRCLTRYIRLPHTELMDNNDDEYITIKDFQRKFPGILRGLRHRIVITRYGDDIAILTPTDAAGELGSD